MKRLAVVGITALLLGVRDGAGELEHRVYLPNITRTVIPEQGAGATYADCERLDGLSWFYDWSPDPPDCPGRVAMIWGRGDVGAEVDTDWVMGCNECDNPLQGNITPTLYAEIWHTMESAYLDKRLVSPSAGLGWLTAWYDSYISQYGQPPRVDAVGHHCYGAYDAGWAIAKCKASAHATVAWAETRGIAEVWVTEFAHLPCWIDEADSIEFMEAMVAHYRADPAIARWAWFQNSYHGDERWAFGEWCNTSLVDIDTGKLTPLGTAYRDLN